MVEPSIDFLDKIVAFFGISINQIEHLNKETSTSEQLEDKSNVLNIIDTMLTNQKFQDFFQQNVAQ